MTTQKQKVQLTIPLLNYEQALLIHDVINVDKEFKGGSIKRELQIEGDNLLVTFEGEDYKKLRVSVNSFLKNVHLILKTITLF